MTLLLWIIMIFLPFIPVWIKVIVTIILIGRYLNS